MAKYTVTESVSGDKLTVVAKNPKEAIVKYLNQDGNVSDKCNSWNWDFEVVKE